MRKAGYCLHYIKEKIKSQKDKLFTKVLLVSNKNNNCYYLLRAVCARCCSKSLTCVNLLNPPYAEYPS